MPKSTQRVLARPNRNALPLRRKPIAEALERRVLLAADIQWENRGSDNFEIYGAQANQARAIVDRAMLDWETAIGNFNFYLGDNFEVNLSAANLGGSTRGQSLVTGYNIDGAPTDADIVMDDDGGGRGWYFDQAIYDPDGFVDDGEFTEVVSATTARLTAPATPASQRDFYRTALHEIGHALGISIGGSSAMDDLLVDTGFNDGSGTLFYYNHNGIEATFTDVGGLHLFEGFSGTTPAGFNYPTHPNHLMNPGRAAVGNTRQVIDDLTLRILSATYGYDYNPDFQDNRDFRIASDSEAGVLRLNGDLGDTLADSIYVDNFLNFDQNLPTGYVIRANVGGRVAIRSWRNYPTIDIQAGSGNDYVAVQSIASGTDVIGDLGAGVDQVIVGSGNLEANIRGDVRFTSTQPLGVGYNQVEFNDINETGSSVWTITADQITKSTMPGIDFEFDVTQRIIKDGLGGNLFSINGNRAGSGLQLRGNGGNDTFNAGVSQYAANVLGDLVLVGGSGSDRVNIRNTQSGATDYIFDDGEFTIDGRTGTLTYAGLETVNLQAGSDNDIFDLRQTQAGTTHELLPSAGYDQLLVGNGDLIANLLSPLVFINGDKPEKLRINDINGGLGRSYLFDTSPYARFDESEFNGDLPLVGYDIVELFGANAGASYEVRATTSGQSIRVFGGDGNDFFNVANGDFDNLAATLEIDGGSQATGGFDRLFFDDSVDLGNDTYVLSDTFIQKPGSNHGAFSFFDIESTALVGNAGSNRFDIFGTAPFNSVDVRGGEGDDLFFISPTSGRAAGLIEGPIKLNGGPGTDRTIFNDASATAPRTYSLSNRLQTNLGDVVTFDNHEKLDVLGGTGLSTFNLGNGLLGFLNFVATDAVVLQGNGIDTIFADDSSSLGAGAYTLRSGNLTRNGVVPVGFAGVDLFDLKTTSSGDFVDVYSTPTGANTRIATGNGVDFINAYGTSVLQADRNEFILDAGAEEDYVVVDSAGVTSAHVIFDTTQTLAALTVVSADSSLIDGYSHVTLAAGGDVALKTRALYNDFRSRLDLNDNFFILQDDFPVPTTVVSDYIRSAYNGGDWTGYGITSSVAASDNRPTGLGYAVAGELGIQTFGGLPVSSFAIVVRYTLQGDSNLDGLANLTDFVRYRNGFVSTTSLWSSGNFNYDDEVNLTDFVLLRNVFGDEI